MSMMQELLFITRIWESFCIFTSLGIKCVTVCVSSWYYCRLKFPGGFLRSFFSILSSFIELAQSLSYIISNLLTSQNYFLAYLIPSGSQLCILFFIKIHYWYFLRLTFECECECILWWNKHKLFFGNMENNYLSNPIFSSA